MTKEIIYIAVIVMLFGCTEKDNISNARVSSSISEYGKVKCESFPSGAKIYLDSIYTGKVTPAILDSVKTGYHQIRLSKKYFVDTIDSIFVKRELYSSVNAQLRHSVNLSPYYPLYVGSIWNFSGLNFDSTFVDTITHHIADIIDYSNKGPLTIFITVYKYSGHFHRETSYVEVKSDSLIFWSPNMVHNNVLLVPMTVGLNWHSHGMSPNVITAIDTITIQNGDKIAAFKMHYIIGDHESCTEWISPTIGHVQYRYSSSTFGGNMISTLQLGKYLVNSD